MLGQDAGELAGDDTKGGNMKQETEFEREEARRARARRLYWLIDAENKSIENAALVRAERERKERARLIAEAAALRRRLAEADARQAAKAGKVPNGGRVILSEKRVVIDGRPFRETRTLLDGRETLFFDPEW